MKHFIWRSTDGSYSYYITMANGRDLPAVNGFRTMGAADIDARARIAELDRKPLLYMGDVEMRNAQFGIVLGQ